MIGFREIADGNPALMQSPLVRGLISTLGYAREHGGIGLTPSKAFKRSFVTWAAAEFDWPGHTEADLFAVNKVLNEADFFPLLVLHELMLALKLGRHFKGEFRVTKAGQALADHPGRLFAAAVPGFLFRVDHAGFSRFDEPALPGTWDIFLNVLNVETEPGATGAQLRRVFFGEPGPGAGFDRLARSFYVQVLRPLCWAGLLQEHREADSFRHKDSLFLKTPLWREALILDTDADIVPVTRH